MKKLAKDIFKDLTPPLLFKVIKKLKSKLISKTLDHLEWEYISEGWARQTKDSNIKGWNVESVLAAYQANWPTFIKNLETTLPFGISPESGTETHTDLMFHNILMTYGYALALASRQKSSLRMLDWGGAIGHYYLISQKLVPDLTIEYSCKDVSILTRYGQSLFPNAHFYSDESCLKNKYDFILASGSFQYSQDWKLTLKGLAEATAGYLFVTRLPIVHNVSSYVMVQRPYQYGYNTEYLGWCFNKEEFLQYAESINLKLFKEFVIGENPIIYNAPEQCQYWGFLFSYFQ